MTKSSCKSIHGAFTEDLTGFSRIRERVPHHGERCGDKKRPTPKDRPKICVKNFLESPTEGCDDVEDAPLHDHFGSEGSVIEGSGGILVRIDVHVRFEGSAQSHVEEE